MDASSTSPTTAIASIPVRLHVLIGVLVVWCASGLVAFDMSRLFPSAMTPVLAKLTVPIMLSGGLLMIAPFVAHATGLISYKNFRFWQPGRGGSRFVYAQTAGWSLYAGGLILVVVWLVDKFVARDSCPPGILIGIAVLSLAGNGTLLGSLHLFNDYSGHDKGERAPLTVTRLLLGASTGILGPALFLAILVAFNADAGALASSHAHRHLSAAIWGESRDNATVGAVPTLMALSAALSTSVLPSSNSSGLLGAIASLSFLRVNATATPTEADTHADPGATIGGTAQPSSSDEGLRQAAVSTVILAVLLSIAQLVRSKRKRSVKLLATSGPMADYEAALLARGEDAVQQAPTCA